MGGCCSCGGKATAPDTVEPHMFFFKKRGCTDCCCLIFFLLFWVGMSYITYLSVTVGDPLSIQYGSDYLGNRCGVGAMADRPAAYYPRVDKDIIAQAAIASTMPWRLAFYGLCLEDCPNVTTPQTCFADPGSCRVYDYGTEAQYEAAGGSASYYAVMPSLKVLNRCIPNDANSLSQAPDRCAFPQCDGVNYYPCDPEYPTTWQMSWPRAYQCGACRAAANAHSWTRYCCHHCRNRWSLPPRCTRVRCALWPHSVSTPILRCRLCVQRWSSVWVRSSSCGRRASRR